MNLCMCVCMYVCHCSVSMKLCTVCYAHDTDTWMILNLPVMCVCLSVCQSLSYIHTYIHTYLHTTYIQYGATALMLAALFGHQAVVRLLLDRGANLNARDKVSFTDHRLTYLLQPQTDIDIHTYIHTYIQLIVPSCDKGWLFYRQVTIHTCILTHLLPLRNCASVCM